MNLKGTTQNNLNIGDGLAGDKSITANNADATKPAIKYNDTTNKWQFANDGATWKDILSTVWPVNTFADQSGVIYKGSSIFLHDFNYGNNGTVTTDGSNTFLGVGAGNLTMGATATQTWFSSFNTGIGNGALSSLTIGFSNAALGANALGTMTTGSRNAAIGEGAGRFVSGGGANATSTSSFYLGFDARPIADGDTNEIIIGASSIGAGSNSVVLGNDSITLTRLKGSVGVGVAAPTARLHLPAGTTAASTAPGKLTSGPLLTTPEAGAIEFLTDALHFTITTGAARKQIAFTSDIASVNSGANIFLSLNYGGF